MCNGGDCRWETHFRLAHQKVSAGKPPSGKSGQVWRFSGGPKAAAVAATTKEKSGGEQRIGGVSREAERVEKVMQLILWGPN